MAKPLGRRRALMVSKNFRDQLVSLPLGPQAIRKGCVSPKARMYVEKRRNSVAYSSGCMLPPQPQFSLPTPQ